MKETSKICITVSHNKQPYGMHKGREEEAWEILGRHCEKKEAQLHWEGNLANDIKLPSVEDHVCFYSRLTYSHSAA